MSAKPDLKIHWILWGAMLFSVFIYGALTFVIPAPEGFEADMSSLPIMAGAFGMTSVSMVGVAYFLRKTMFFDRKEKGELTTPSKLRATYQTICILSFAFAESVAVFGLVLYMLSYQQIMFLPFAAFSLLLFVLFRPNPEHVSP